MYVKSIQLWDYVTSFFRSTINMLSLHLFSLSKNINCIMKVKKNQNFSCRAKSHVNWRNVHILGIKAALNLLGKKTKEKN